LFEKVSRSNCDAGKPFTTRSECGIPQDMQAVAADADLLKPRWITGHLPAFAESPLKFIEACAASRRPLVPLRFVNRPLLFVNEPAVIEQILVTDSRRFQKTPGYRATTMRRIFGEGLITSEGAKWQRQRKLSQPAFHRARIEQYGNTIQRFTQEMTSSWQTGQTVDVHEQMMRLTTRVITQALFTAEVPNAIRNMRDSSAAVMRAFRQQWNFWRLLRQLFPSKARREFHRVITELDQYILTVIKARRQETNPPPDLLTALLQARDEGGESMTDVELLDELKTLMAAGLDTTALTLSWAIHLLSTREHLQEELRVEVSRSVGHDRPEYRHVPQLGAVERVIKETMRLYPPVWLIGRQALENVDTPFGTIASGTSCIMSQWTMHRDARFFADPGAFKPERWLDTASGQTLPKYAFFPFGGGPRVCIGAALAMVEAVLVLAELLWEFRWSAAGNERVEPWASITLQPSCDIVVRLDRLR
jgi:cytochrome P450